MLYTLGHITGSGSHSEDGFCSTGLKICNELNVLLSSQGKVLIRRGCGGNLCRLSFFHRRNENTDNWKSNELRLSVGYLGLDALTPAVCVDTRLPYTEPSTRAVNLTSLAKPHLLSACVVTAANLLHFLAGKIPVSIIQGRLHLSRNYRM